MDYGLSCNKSSSIFLFASMSAQIISVLILSVYVYLPPFNSNHALYLPTDHLFIAVIFKLPKNSVAISRHCTMSFQIRVVNTIQ